MRPTSKPRIPKIGTSMGLQALQEAVNELEQLEVRAQEVRALRDRYLAELVGDVKMSRLVHITKLSRQQIWRIAPGRQED